MACAVYFQSVDPSVNGKGRNVDIITRNQDVPSTSPITCAPPSKDEITDLELEKELKEMYKIATWQMYHRIQASRLSNVYISKPCSHTETRHQSITTHSQWSQENILCTSSNNSDSISQFSSHGYYDQPLCVQRL